MEGIVTMLQDITPHIFSNAFCPQEPKPEDLLLIYSAEGILSHTEELRLPQRKDFPKLPVRFAFSMDGRSVYLAQESVPAGEGWHYVPSKKYRYGTPPDTVFAASVGETLYRWYSSNRFCGRCGSATVDSTAERALCCPNCGYIVYPRINPAVIVAVTDGDRLLLTKYAGRSFKKYALVAGFCEIGETVEETVCREVMEEVGLRVKNLRFYKSQPWVLTDSLLLGFFCEVDGDSQTTLRDGELSLAQWFSRKELPGDHSGISLTGEMIEVFRNGREP